jgi:hypothetical protein
MWQRLQATVVCAPVSGKPVALWLKTAPSHEVVVWHDTQVVGYPEVM